MPSEQLHTIVQLLRSRPVQREISFQEARRAFEQTAWLFAPPKDVRSESVDAAGVPGEWISTPESEDGRTIYYLHGGGYSMGSVNTHRSLISRICRAARARAFAIDYRLAPEHPFPAAVEDATAAYRWLLSAGANPARTVIAGDSAGGGLAMATLLALRDAGDPLPAAAICLSPWTDLAVTGASMISRAEVDPMVQREDALKGAAAYLGGAHPRNPLASPIYADLSGLPPLLIHVGTAETLLDDSVRLSDRARGAGVDVTLEPWDDMIHVWHFFGAMLPEAQQATDRIGEFIRQHTS